MNLAPSVPTFRARKAVLGLSIAALAMLIPQYILSTIPAHTGTGIAVRHLDLLYTVLFALAPLVLLILYSASFSSRPAGRFLLFSAFALYSLEGLYDILTYLLRLSLRLSDMGINLLFPLLLIVLFGVMTVFVAMNKKPPVTLPILLTVAVALSSCFSIFSVVNMFRYFSDIPLFLVADVLGMIFMVLSQVAVLLCAFGYPIVSPEPAEPVQEEQAIVL